MNDTWRLIFAAALGFSLLILMKNWDEWRTRETATDFSPTIIVTDDAQSAQPPNVSSDDGDVPVATQSLSGGSTEAIETAAPTESAADGRDNIRVETDWLSVVISQDGGNLLEVRLKKHLLNGEPLHLLENNERQYIAQSGLIGVKDAPNHNNRYQLSGGGQSVLADADSPLVTVELTAVSGEIELSKTYIFSRADYLISVILSAKNLQSAPVNLHGYFQLAHDGTPPRDYSSVLPTFFGAGMYTQDNKFVKVDFDDIGDDSYPRKSDNGWIGIIQRYFAAVWLPPVGVGEREFFMRKSSGGARVGVILPLGAIDIGETRQVTARLFAGAQEQDILQQLHDDNDAPGINLIVDYGWLTFIAVLLFKMLSAIQSFAANWGVAIILLTFGIKLLFYPLSSTAYRSMAKMKEEAPRIKQLQERFGDDKQRMQKEMMALYREKKINPLGGCLPILVQIPVFIALYWVLLGSVELRQAPFIGWIDDLSAPDAYFILPLIMGVSMFMQTRLSPAPPDPTQAMIMKIMPIGFALFSIFFPSGLVLYWAVNTILSIAQQWYIMRSISRAKNKKP